MKNPLYTWIPPVLTVLLTAIGFAVLRPEETTALYWINMVYLLFLEALFFGWFEVGRWKGTQTSYWSVFLGVHILFYIFVSIAWMWLYALLLRPWVSLAAYGVSIGALTVVWLTIASIVGRKDASYNTQQTALENHTQAVRSLVAELKEMQRTHSTPETERAWKNLIREADSIPPKELGAHDARLRQKARELIR
ncbi:MAG: hypothetical protein K2H62_04970 [Bacteroidales bacterium]|nr:hypothetical protein [Bacteroidales bacterium]